MVWLDKREESQTTKTISRSIAILDLTQPDLAYVHDL